MGPTPSRPRATTVDPASASYYDDLRRAGFISIRQLAAARSKDQAAATAADALASKYVLTASTVTAARPRVRTRPSAIRRTTQPFLDDLHGQQRVKDTLLKTKYTALGYQFAFNNSAGHNCLLTSILQHVQGDYGQNHQVLADEYRAKLNDHIQQGLTPERKNKFSPNDLLDASHAEWLLNEMAADPYLKYPDLKVECWVADNHGDPVKIVFGKGKTTVVIFNSTSHFEAVTGPSTSAATTRSATTRNSTPVTFRR